MKFKIIEKAICLALALSELFSFTGFAAACSGISDSVLRLHILANSDSEEDQALKLKVRDRLLTESAGMLDGVSSRGDAEAVVREKLPELKAAAEDEIRRQGYDYQVKVELTNMYFTTRQYNTVSLPAGRYDALRVSIGAAEGKNWWCVIFPQMCLPTAGEKQELEDVLDAEQMDIVEDGGQNSGYEVKWKCLEFFEQLRSWLCGG